MRKTFSIFLAIIFCAVGLFSITSPTLAEDENSKINIHFFYGDGCPHCAEEEVFLDELEKKNEDIVVSRYEVWYNTENQDLLNTIGEKLDIKTNAVPVTFINGKVVFGYGSEETTGNEIEVIIETLKKNENYYDPISDIISGKEPNLNNTVKIENKVNLSTSEEKDNIPKNIHAPIFGDISISDLSLPVLAIVMGGLDGFNPCALWVLFFLISLLIGMKDTRRMWIFGIVFLVASTFVYFLFMTAWLNLLLFIGFIFWIRLAIGLIALGSGGYHLYSFYKHKGECKVAGTKRKQKITERLRKVTETKSFWLAIGGLIIVAFSVNLVELLCSAGFPAIFTQVLTMSDLPTWQYYAYILLYLLIFILDDLLIFTIAMLTLKTKVIGSKYAKYSSLIGGILMLIIGIILILRPEWLMFG